MKKKKKLFALFIDLEITRYSLDFYEEEKFIPIIEKDFESQSGATVIISMLIELLCK